MADLPEGKSFPQDSYMCSTVPNHVVVLAMRGCGHCERQLKTMREVLPHVNKALRAGGCGPQDQLHMTVINGPSMGRGFPSSAVFKDDHAEIHRGGQGQDFMNKLAAQQAEIQARISARMNKSVSGFQGHITNLTQTANNAMDTVERGKGLLDKLRGVASKVEKGVEAAAPEIEEGAEAAAMIAGGGRRRASRASRTSRVSKTARVSAGHARRLTVGNHIKAAIFNLGAGEREKWSPSSATVTETLARGVPSASDPSVMEKVEVYTLLNNEATGRHLAIFGEVLGGEKLHVANLHPLEVLNHIPEHSKSMASSSNIATILREDLGFTVEV